MTGKGFVFYPKKFRKWSNQSLYTNIFVKVNPSFVKIYILWDLIQHSCPKILVDRLHWISRFQSYISHHDMKISPIRHTIIVVSTTLLKSCRTSSIIISFLYAEIPLPKWRILSDWNYFGDSLQLKSSFKCFASLKGSAENTMQDYRPILSSLKK